MCGISGIIINERCSLPLENLGISMNQELKHRGPDNSGHFLDINQGLLLNHTRLSINDLSKKGNQPMTSKSGRYVIVFNGEIYNHIELKKELKSNWDGNSDTEVLLAGIEEWGLETTLNNSIGMFAFALYDQKEKIIKLVRDRLGEKPLYWGFAGEDNDNMFVFSSEINAFKVIPEFNNKINIESLSLLINYSYIPCPYSIYNRIWKLTPGNILELKLPLKSYKNNYKPKSWWKLTDAIIKSSDELVKDEVEATLLIEDSLKRSIKYTSRADVKLTTFLSGGVDSSLITAILQSQSWNRINTFTVGFENKDFNEAPYAKSIADYLNTNHNELTFTDKNALDIVPNLHKYYTEPFADPASIPTFLMCELANKSGFKVALSGDGADEIFGGYNRYTLAPKIWSKFSKINPKLRPLISNFIELLPGKLIRASGQLLGITQFAERIEKLSNRINYANSIEELHQLLVKEWHDISAIMHKSFDERYAYEIGINTNLNELNLSSISNMMTLDCLSYLPDNNQVKLDRAAMSVSLETRSPFLDKDLVDDSWRIQEIMKIRNSSGKFILKSILGKYLPTDLYKRSKSGFATPIKEWLRGPLKHWADDLLSTKMLNDELYLDNKVVNKLWSDHISAKSDNSKKLWPILIWKNWYYHNQ
tara:strand:+ start:2771 stop:4717 length:1947 start_codon:yes stop_codon:yes gene_type:complete